MPPAGPSPQRRDADQPGALTAGAPGGWARPVRVLGGMRPRQHVQDVPTPPGAEEPRRFRPRLRYELLACATRGHELIGTDVATIVEDDALVARAEPRVRWHRCLRCDSWLPMPPPSAPQRDRIGRLDDIEVPLRGRPLRDRYVLRLIALDRGLHVVVLAAIAVVIVVYATHHNGLDAVFTRVLKDVQGGVGGPVHGGGGSLAIELRRVMAINTTNLYIAAVLVAAYAALEATEMVGLWLAKRWAEYLTFVATLVFIPYEVWELTRTVSWLKLVALVINVAIAVYLLLAKRLFGVRGGGAALERQRERDTGWAAVRRATWWLPEPGQEAPPPAWEASGPRRGRRSGAGWLAARPIWRR